MRKENRHSTFNRTVLLITSVCLAMSLAAQQAVKVYVDKQLPATDKAAIREMIGFLKQSSGAVFTYDSISRFNGSGIYATTNTLDNYRKAPTGLQKMGAEGLYIKSTDKYLYITANSSLGLREALFVYLEKQGFRFYFPDQAWTIIPQKKPALIPAEVLFQPDFASREMFMGFGYGNDELQQKYLNWQRINRMGGAMDVRNEHAYYGLVDDFKAEFQKHPEYLSLPLVNGNKQYAAVLNYGNPGLVQLAHQWLAKGFDDLEKKGTPASMLSLEPFDGGNFCALPSCKVAGQTVSDQVFYFTNQVAKLLKKSHPGKKIGVLAYNDHIDIPKYPIEDNVFVTITNGYNTSTYTTDELISRWRTKVSILGIYDYFSIYASSYDQPGSGLAGKYQRVADLLKKYKKQNIIAFKAETTYGWIPKGLSHYIAARMTWDSSLTADSLVNEFFDLCFPQTKKWIRPVFDQWNTNYIMSENDLYQWFTAVKNALTGCNEPSELKRLNQFALYIYYVKLLKTYSESPADKKEQATLELTSFLWKILDEGVVASASALNSLPEKIIQQYNFFDPAAPWKSYKIQYPANKAEWLSFINAYLPALKHMEPVRDFDAVPMFTKQERQAITFRSPYQNAYKTINFRGTLTFIVDTKNSDSLYVKLWAGREKKIGKIRLKIFRWNDKMKTTGEPLKEFSYSANETVNTANFGSLPRDRYVVSVDDESSGGSIYFPEKLRYSILASAANPITGGSNNYFFFYVPKGTTRFYIVKNIFVRIIDPNMKSTDYETTEKMVEIKPGDRWGWWLAQFEAEDIYFKGIPPLVSRNAESFFMPD